MMNPSRTWLAGLVVGMLVAVLALAGVGTACTITPPAEKGTDVGIGLDSAPAAKTIASLTFRRTVVETFAFGDVLLVVYEDKDIGVFDLSDPTAPRATVDVLTNARVVGIEYDAERQIAYALDAAGVVWLLNVRSAAGTAVITSLAVSSIGSSATGIARLGNRLFIVGGGSTVQSVRITFLGDDPTTLALDAVVDLGQKPLRIAAGGDLLYFAFAGGTIGSWTVALDGPLVANTTFAVGGDIRALLAKGSKVVVLSRDIGLQVVDFAMPGSPVQLSVASEFKDVSAARLFGRTLLVALDRGFLTTLDLSIFTQPRAVTTNKGALPIFFSIVEGNVVFGSATQGVIAGIPPVVSAFVPVLIQNAFPLDGQLPVTFSKSIDIATVSTQTVKLTCNGQLIAGTTAVSLDRLTLSFRGSLSLPAGASCVLDVSGVKDTLGLSVASGSLGIQIKVTTAKEAPAPVVNGASKYKHSADGAFTDWVAGAAQHEWFDVRAAKGMYTYFYADFDGANLWLLNDWFYDGEKIEPDCYNQFYAWTGGGSERWEIRAYGDKHVEVRKNGEILDTKASGVEGGASFSASPNVSTPHTIYELKIPAAPGGWGVQLHDPGPTFSCSKRMGDPTQMQGQLTGGASSSSVDTSGRLVTPPAPVPMAPANDATNVDLRPAFAWTSDAPPSQFVVYLVQVATDESFKQSVLYGATYEKALVPRRGVLVPGTRYYWRVFAWNWGGLSASATRAFTTLPGTGETLLAVGGTVNGLVGTGLVLQNNGGDDLLIAANGTFAFAKKLTSGASFGVTVKTQPAKPSQTCTVSGASGTIAGGNVTSVMVNCATQTFAVGGTVTGLVGKGLVLQNKGGPDLVVNVNGTFAFPVPVASGATYAVTVKTQPNTPSQTCTIGGGAGPVAAANVTSVAVACTTNKYRVGGNVAGLVGSGLVLQVNGGDNLPVAASGSFTFPTPIASGAGYAVTVSAQPVAPDQICAVTNGTGTLGAADVTNVTVTCKNTYSIGGSVTGLTGAGLVLQNNAGDDLPVAATGAFAFATKLVGAQVYAVTIKTQPAGQTCSVANGSGTVAFSNVSNVTIACSAPPPELFVSNDSAPAGVTPSIVVFDATASGNVAPKRSISGAATLLTRPAGLAVVNDEIYVADDLSSISVFNRLDTGNVAPKRRIAGPLVQFKNCGAGLHVAGGEVFSGCRQDGVKVWNTTDNGDVPPKRSLIGIASARYVWVDAGELYVADSGVVGSVRVYPQAAAGMVAPTRTIGTSSLTPVGLYVLGTELFVSTGNGASVEVHDKMTGALLRTIQGANTQLTYTDQCVVVQAGEGLYCGSANSVLVFFYGDNGNVAPMRQISGAATMLNGARGVFVY